MTDRPAYSFNPGPPPDAMAFLTNKGLKPAFSWADVEPEEHAVAFTVAKAMQADVLQDIRSAVEQALAEGQTFAQFKKALKPSLVKQGWWGEQTMVDPLTNKARTVQLGSPRRLKTIYQSNLRSARAAGQWNRIQRTKAVRPYLVYNLGPSERHRAAHVAKRGLVLPVDDPFWLTWYPPNGWGCKCWVRQINKREAEQIGIREAPLVETRPWTNWRTGEIRQVPLGIDPGWQSNPGALRQRRMDELLTEKLGAADPMVTQVALRDIAGSWRMQRMLAGTSPGQLPIGRLAETAEFVLADDATAAAWRALDGVLDDDVIGQLPDLIATGRVSEIDGQILITGLAGRSGDEIVLQVTRRGDQLFVTNIQRAADAAPEPRERQWRYQQVIEPKSLSEAEAFVTKNEISEAVNLRGISMKDLGPSFRAMLEVKERFDVAPLTGLGPASRFGYGRMPSNVNAAILYQNNSDKVRFFHMPADFGSRKKTQARMASSAADADRFHQKQ